jgi:DNA-binding transcriptional LysR family regulator
MQNLEPILIFITVADMGSFTHAAESLGIQKGSASTAVRKLEEDVGVRLLHRTTRSVQLTEDGRVFHARARDLLADVDDPHSMFASDRVALRGRLRVDLPSELARTTFVPALPAFMATHPELELEVSSTDRQVDLVQEGFDCVLRLGPIRDETLIARPLGKLRMVNAASPAYLARYGVPRSLEDLHRQPIPGEWSACGDPARFSPPGARRVPGRSTSEQSVAPSPRIHEMDRRCADTASGIARRTSSSGLEINIPGAVRRAGRRPTERRICGSLRIYRLLSMA